MLNINNLQLMIFPKKKKKTHTSLKKSGLPEGYVKFAEFRTLESENVE